MKQGMYRFIKFDGANDWTSYQYIKIQGNVMRFQYTCVKRVLMIVTSFQIIVCIFSKLKVSDDRV